MERLRMWISGRVQGVGFRWHAQAAATRHGCTGWVRNLADGRVEICAEGEPAQLAALEAACQSGPRSGRVDGMEQERAAGTGEFAGFEITG